MRLASTDSARLIASLALGLGIGGAAVVALRKAAPGSATLTVVGAALHDFGTVDDGKVVRHSFAFRNDGQAPLRIQRVRSGCGCLYARSSGPVFEPGETGTIEVAYQVRARSERELARVFVESNDPVRPVTPFTTAVLVRRTLFCRPSSVSLCTQRGARGARRRVLFLSDTATPPTIESCQPSSEHLSVSWHNSEAGAAVCHIEVRPTCPVGVSMEHVRVECRTGPLARSVIVPVYLMVR